MKTYLVEARWPTNKGTYYYAFTEVKADNEAEAYAKADEFFRRHARIMKLSSTPSRTRIRPFTRAASENPVVGTKTYLIEARWYSPTSYEIYHYALAEVEAHDANEAYGKAAEVFRRHGKSFKMGPEPVSFRIVGPGHQYGKGYNHKVDKILRENPLSTTTGITLSVTAVVAAAAVAYLIYSGSKPKAVALPVYLTLTPGPTTVSANGSGVVYAELPANAVWVSQTGGSPANPIITGTTTPIPVYVTMTSYGTTASFVWTNASGPQTTTLNVNP